MNRKNIGSMSALISICIICVYTQTTTTESPQIESCSDKIQLEYHYTNTTETPRCVSYAIEKWNVSDTIGNITLQQCCCGSWDAVDCYVKEAKAKCNEQEIDELVKLFEFYTKYGGGKGEFTCIVNGEIKSVEILSDCQKLKYGYHESGCQKMFMEE